MSKQRGRPQGAKNFQRPVVAHVPPKCPRCGATEREVQRVVKVRDIAGVTRDGQPYNRITWRRVKCSVCPQLYTLISYEFVPDAEKNNQPMVISPETEIEDVEQAGID